MKTITDQFEPETLGHHTVVSVIELDSICNSNKYYSIIKLTENNKEVMTHHNADGSVSHCYEKHPYDLIRREK